MDEDGVLCQISEQKHSTGLGTADQWNKLENTKPDTNTIGISGIVNFTTWIIQKLVLQRLVMHTKKKKTEVDLYITQYTKINSQTKKSKLKKGH